MGARVMRIAAAPSYDAPGHLDVDAVRLQGREAGPTDRFWIGLSEYRPGGIAQQSPASEETVYVVIAGELTLTVEGVQTTLGPGDSVHLSKGSVRTLENRTGAPAKLLVVVAIGPAAVEG
jgi:uncharacterized cupin superfamily protein